MIRVASSLLLAWGRKLRRRGVIRFPDSFLAGVVKIPILHFGCESNAYATTETPRNTNSILTTDYSDDTDKCEKDLEPKTK